MRKVLFSFLCSVLCVTAVNAQTTTTIGTGIDVVNTGATITIPFGTWVVDGTYTDTTSPGLVNLDGGVNISGTGSIRTFDLSFINGGTSGLTNMVSVYNTATVSAGTTVNANAGNLWLRTDIPTHFTTANLVINGVLTGTVTGTQAYATAVNGTCNPYSSTLSTNVSGSVVLYQWESSPNNATWTSIAGATNATYVASVSSNIYYHCIITTSNSSFTSTTGSVLLNAPTSTITGTLSVCVGATTTLSDPTPGGTWTSASTGYATVGSSSGVVTGVSAGTVNISYVVAGCLKVSVVTVNPSPMPITGTTIICIGGTTNLIQGIGGGTWTSASPAVATIGSATGTVTGLTAGASNITYALPNGCFAATTVGVNSLPSVSSTSGNVICSGFNSSVSATPSAGATINWYNSFVGGGLLGTGNVLAVTAPTVTTTFYAEAVDNNLSPLNTTFANNNAQSGIMFDVTMLKSVTLNGFDVSTIAGTLTFEIYYRVGTIVGNDLSSAGWTLAGTYTANTAPSPRTLTLPTSLNLYAGQTYGFYITTTVATSSNVRYTDGTSVGAVFASNADMQVKEGYGKAYPFSTTFQPRIPNINVNYSKPSCSSSPRASAVLTVNPNPAAITGNLNVCFGLTSTLSSATPGGVWSTSNGAVASVGTGTGVVTGVSTGTANITYTLPTGCFIFATVTVNPNPAAIGGGPMAVCVGLTTTLTNGTGGGVWSSSDPSQAMIGSSSGIVTGMSAGNPIITYTLATGCIATQVITVNPNPAAIAGTLTVCIGQTTTLTDATTGGTWTSSAPTTASVGGGTGIVSGILAGTATITYTLPTGCINTAVVTVNSNPTAITGTTNVCTGLTTTLSSTPSGGTWSSSDITEAIVGSSSGIVTGVMAGTLTITYMLSTGCIATTAFTVNQTPAAIGGANMVCVGSSTTLSNAVSGGLWTSSNPAQATVGSTTGLVTGVVAGTPTITYAMSTGCNAVLPMTVNPLPAAIGGTFNVCEGLTTTLTNGSGGGTWTSSNTTLATIGSSSGIVSGLVAGTLNITYTLPTGCIATTPFTVNPTPPAITGPSTVCVGLTITLSNSSPGGTWTSSNGTLATVGSSSGVVTGVATGTPNIIYTLPAGCTATRQITVNPSPAAIGGSSVVCVGLTTTLTNGVGGGVWSSNNPAQASIGSSSGIVSGIAAGTPTITYMLPAGCFVLHPMTVNPTPAAITGTTTVCVGSTVTLTDATSGGTWSSSNPAQATVGSATGIVTGVSAGNPNIIYTLPGGCTATIAITVNAVPDITNYTSTTALNPCLGNSTTVTINSTTLGATTFTVTYSLSGANTSSGNLATLTMGASTGTFTIPSSLLTNAGSTTVTVVGITNALGCTSFPSSSNTAVFTVNTLPTAYTVMGTGSYCSGGAGIHVFLSNSVGGVSYQLYHNGSPTGSPVAGTFAAIDMGAQTAAGTYTIIATNTTTTCTANMTGSAIITVDPLPTVFAVTGGGSYCAGGSGVAIGMANSTSGVNYQLWLGGSPSGSSVAGTGGAISFGNRTSGGTYTAIATNTTTGCTNSMSGSATVIVNPLPAAITGSLNTCVGTTTTLANGTSGGTWSSVNTAVGTIGSSSGVVMGITAGTTVISYTLSTGCTMTATVTVNPLPAAIMGGGVVCVGATRTLTDPTGGGTWSSSNITEAMVGSSTGIVTGMAAGLPTITYTLPTGCIATTVITVNPTPAPIAGTGALCVASSLTLTNTLLGGTWTSSATGVATVGSSSGIVIGVSAGIPTITYTVNGCSAMATVTVNPNPAAIAGASGACVGTSTTLTNATPGGVWSSSNMSIATIGSSSGVVTAVAAGCATITYTLSTGCFATYSFCALAIPGSVTGSTTVCVGLTTTLGNSVSGGTWTSSNNTIATVGSSTGVVTGMLAGTVTMTYTISSGCAVVHPMTVNPLPAAIAGPATVCVGSSTTLSNSSPGGSWSTSNVTIATVSGGGVVGGVAAGTATITYTLPTGCLSTVVVTVNPLPASITGTTTVCVGATTPLANTSSGGTWSSSNTAMASVNASTGLVTGTGAGNPVITYTLPTGCIATTPLTVNATPLAIAGSNMVCTGLTTLLTDASPGGTWSSSDMTRATVGSSSGVVTGVAAGTLTISYSFSTGCAATLPMTVNVQPAPITGLSTVCAGFTTTLGNTTSGGTWTSSDMAMATVGSSSGIVSGTSVGSLFITYTMPGGCYSLFPFTVNPMPAAITGASAVCVSYTITLSDASTGGTWTSSTPATASVGSTTGDVTGITGGTVTITYTLPGGCFVTKPVTVNPLPASIGGSPVVCVNATTTLTNGTSGGVWTSSNTTLATIGSSSGIATGISAGTLTFTYTIPTGCFVTIAGTVNPLPTLFSVTGGGSYCSGGTGVHVGLSSSHTGFHYQLFRGVTTVGSSVAGTGSAIDFGIFTTAGLYTVVATNDVTGCFVTMTGSATITIDPLPTVFNMTGGGNYCAGGTGVAVGLDGSTSGVNYQLYIGGVPSGLPVAGTGSAISFGLKTAAGVYTVVAENATTLCVNNMSGIATVVVNPLPTVYAVTGGGAYCIGGTGVTVGLSNSDIGTSYQLFRGVTPLGTLSGTGTALSFGLQTTAGTYTVVATNTTTCVNNMSGSAVVTINSLPTPFSVTGGGAYCAGGSGVVVSLSGSQSGVNYQLYFAGLPIGSAVAGTGSGISFGLQSGGGVYTVIATSTFTGCSNTMTGSATITVNPLPNIYPVGGGGSYCAGGTGVAILAPTMSDAGISYRLMRGTTLVMTLTGTGGPLSSGLLTTAGIYTVEARNTLTNCSVFMSGSAMISINPLPTAYTVTGTGSYCAGGTGVVVGASSSDAGINYQLFLGASAVGLPVAGTGSAISFGPQLAAGTYTVVATDALTLCTRTMTGSAVVTINPLPTVYNVTGGGSYCAGSTGVHIGTDGSTTGFSYQLFNGASPVGAPVAGTGSALDFGLVTASGSYTVVATNTTTGCTNTMAGTATISITPLPAVNTVTGGGSYCAGGTGVDIDLDGSMTSNSYQLYNGTTAMGAPMTGTGAALDFGDWTVAGTYTVIATDLTFGCTNTMAGSATIIINPLPAAFVVTGGGAYCAGGTGVNVGLTNSVMGINYQLQLGGAPVGAPMAGTGSALDFGLQILAGTYTIEATDGVTGCINNMSGSVAVIINALPNIYTVTGGGNYCIGGGGVGVGLTSSDLGDNYQLYLGTSPIGTPVAGTGGPISFGMQTAAGSYTVVSMNGTSGCTSNMTGSAVVVIDPLPVVYTITGGGSYCVGGTGVNVSLSGSDIGTSYQLFNGTLSTGAPVAGTGGAISFGLQTVAGTYTVEATSASSCVNDMAGSVPVSINPLPAVYTVTGGGSYCAGGTGVNIGLTGSNSGINYQLYNGTATVGGPLAGTGSLLDFGVFSAAGTYTVVAIDGTTACTENMSGAATITINALPTAYVVTGGGSYCTGGAGLSVGLSSSDAGVTYQLFRGTSMVGLAQAGTGMSLDFGVQIPGLYTVVATDATTGCIQNMTGSVSIVVNTLPTVFTVTGGGSYCTGGTGFAIGLSGSSFGVNYQLYNGASPVGAAVAGTGSPVSFGVLAVAGTYTVVATNPSTGCTSNMTGSATITINPLPVVYTVTGGGNYCSGGTGVHIGLSGSNIGINYKLYRGTTLVATMAGNDSTLDFGMHTTAGAYTIEAVAPTSCTSTMTGSAIVAIDALPTAFAVTGGGSYCAGGYGLHVTLSSSTAGVNYQLYRDGTPVGGLVPGTGFVLDMGIQSFAGSYTIKGTNTATGCINNMSGSTLIAINPLPTAFLLTGGGSYCAGGAGLGIVLSGSVAGVQYQLFRGSTMVGPPMPGTGSSIDFGLHTTGGTYTVKATNTFTTCTNLMTGAVAIVVNTLPATYSVFGGGSYCAGGAGVTVSMTGSETGVSYQLLRDGTPSGAPVAGTGVALGFGAQTLPGIYTVVATNSTTACTRNMAGTATVIVNPLPTIFAVTGGGGFCAGGAGLHVGLSGSNTGITYQLRIGGTPIGAPLAGTGLALDFGLITTGAVYTVTAHNLTTGCTSTMTGAASIVVNSLPTAYAVTGGGSYCSGGTGVNVSLGNSQSGIEYQLFNGTIPMGSPVAGTGGAVGFGPQTLAGTYTVVATNTVTGCTNTMTGSVSVTITPTVIPTVTVISGLGDSVCDGTTVSFNVLTTNAGGSPSFSWSVNTVPVGSSGGSYTYIPLNGDVVSVTMTSSAACATPATATDNLVMTVETNQTPVVTITATPGDTICQGTAVTLNQTSMYGGTAPGFTWYLNGAPVSLSSSFSYVPTNGDVVFCEMISNYRCKTDSAVLSNNVKFFVDMPDTPMVRIDFSNAGILDSYKVVIVNDPHGDHSYTYTWYVGGNLMPQTTPYLLQVPDSLAAGTEIMCVATRYNPCGLYHGIGTYTVTPGVGVNTITYTAGDIRLIPNPNKGTFTLNGSFGTIDNVDVSVEITNMLGQVVYTGNTVARNGELNERIQLGNLANGMYLVNVRTTGGNKVFHMVIEQ